MKHILKCQQCGEYTMKQVCACKGEAVTTRPPRYSPGRYAEYRKKARREELINKGLL